VSSPPSPFATTEYGKTVATPRMGCAPRYVIERRKRVKVSR
jgi:hypothetical protein